jgi:hypothetical protein
MSLLVIGLEQATQYPLAVETELFSSAVGGAVERDGVADVIG